MSWFRKTGPDETKNRAYLTYIEWGPDLRIPRDQRLAERFPEIPEATRAAWIVEFKSIDAEVWKVAEEGGPQRYSFGAFEARLTRLFPFMNRTALEKAWSRAGYYAWHEGYDR